MNKVHLFTDHAACVHWIDTVYVQKYISTELSKGQFSQSKKICYKVVIFYD